MQRLLVPCVGLGLGFYSPYKHAAGSLISRVGQCTPIIFQDCEACCFVFSRNLRIVVYFFPHWFDKDMFAVVGHIPCCLSVLRCVQ